MRRWRSLLAMGLAAGISLSGAWLLMAWSEAGAPSLVGFAQRHPMLGAVVGALSSFSVVASVWWQRLQRASR